MRAIVTRLCSVLACGLVLAGCGNSKPPEDLADPRLRMPAGSIADVGSIFSPSRGSGADRQDQGGALGVNAYLWRGALETLSFMPMITADPFGGVIITDWYQPPGSGGERFKATAFILGRTLRADGVRVSLFRQVLQGGNWVDAPMPAAAAGEMENKILARARDLRVQQVRRD